VCENHVDASDENIKKRKRFKCSLCDVSHEMESNKKFAPNTTVEKLLKIEIETRLNLGDAHQRASKEIAQLELTFERIAYLLSDPALFVHEHVSELKRRVDLRRDKLNEMCNEMAEKLNAYERACYDNTAKLIKDKKYQDNYKKISDMHEPMIKDFKSKIMTIDDLQRKSIQSKIKDIDIYLLGLTQVVKDDLLMGKVWSHQESEQVSKELSKELCMFET
jgi:hypothetical protein